MCSGEDRRIGSTGTAEAEFGQDKTRTNKDRSGTNKKIGFFLRKRRWPKARDVFTTKRFMPVQVFRVLGLLGLGFKVYGLGSRVQGSGFLAFWQSGCFCGGWFEPRLCSDERSNPLGKCGVSWLELCPMPMRV